MRIGILGGLDRNESVFQEMAEAAGHRLEFHRGKTHGRSGEELGAMVSRVDRLVIVTDVNSHGAVQLARRMARKHNTPLLYVRRCGGARISALLAEMTAEHQPARRTAA